MTELTKEKKIALGVTIAVVVAIVFIIIIVIVVVIKRKNAAEEEETKEGFETGKNTIPRIILSSYLNSVLTKDIRTLSSVTTNTVVYAIQRSINKARKDLDTAVETFKKNCEARGVKNHNQATGLKKTMIMVEKAGVNAKYELVVELYKVLGNVVSKIDKGREIITEVAVPYMQWTNVNTTLVNPDVKLTIETDIKNYILNNSNYMEVPKYNYVQASFGGKRKIDGKEEIHWHSSSYKFNPQKEVGIAKVEEVKPIKNEVVISNVAESKPIVMAKVEEVKPVIEEVKPNVEEVKPIKKEEVVVSNYVEPIRVAESQSASLLKTESQSSSVLKTDSNIIEAKVENPKAETVQAAVVNKAVGIDFNSNGAQSDTVRLPAGAICTNDEQEVKFLKALRALK